MNPLVYFAMNEEETAALEALKAFDSQLDEHKGDEIEQWLFGLKQALQNQMSERQQLIFGSALYKYLEKRNELYCALNSNRNAELVLAEYLAKLAEDEQNRSKDVISRRAPLVAAVEKAYASALARVQSPRPDGDSDQSTEA